MKVTDQFHTFIVQTFQHRCVFIRVMVVSEFCLHSKSSKINIWASLFVRVCCSSSGGTWHRYLLLKDVQRALFLLDYLFIPPSLCLLSFVGFFYIWTLNHMCEFKVWNVKISWGFLIWLSIFGNGPRIHRGVIIKKSASFLFHGPHKNIA